MEYLRYVDNDSEITPVVLDYGVLYYSEDKKNSVIFENPYVIINVKEGEAVTIAKTELDGSVNNIILYEGSNKISATTGINVISGTGVESVIYNTLNVPLSAFCGTSITSIKLSNFIKNIDNASFAYCSNLKEIVMPNYLKSIGDSAFYHCTSLTGITIPDSVTNIGNSAFYSCTTLTFVSLPSGLTSIGNYAFFYCTRLTSITYDGTVSQWNSITKGTSWHYNVPSTAVITCTDGTLSI